MSFKFAQVSCGKIPKMLEFSKRNKHFVCFFHKTEKLVNKIKCDFFNIDAPYVSGEYKRRFIIFSKSFMWLELRNTQSLKTRNQLGYLSSLITVIFKINKYI